MTTIENEVTHEHGQQITPRNGGMLEVATSRAAQEVQAAMVIAKKMPRDENAAFSRIMKACKRTSLAEQALYEYPRGNEKVEGPSIRLAEALAQNWGNIDFGIVEIDQRGGESTVMSYAWDLETNTRQSKVFTVPHKRHTKKGSYVLEDPRDIYEMVANQGARRLRACILGIIPGDIVDAAVEECNKTLKGKNAEPLADRIRKMISAFSEIGVTAEMIERKFGHKVDVLSETELVKLRKTYQSIKDGIAGREDCFEVTAAEASKTEDPTGGTKTERMAAKFKKNVTAPTATEAPKQSEPTPAATPTPEPKPQTAAPAGDGPFSDPAPAAEAPEGVPVRQQVTDWCEEQGITERELCEALIAENVIGSSVRRFSQITDEKLAYVLTSKEAIIKAVAFFRSENKR